MPNEVMIGDVMVEQGGGYARSCQVGETMTVVVLREQSEVVKLSHTMLPS
jgi:chemotaxis receptor (MCP) glutamine deamidase CheD